MAKKSKGQTAGERLDQRLSKFGDRWRFVRWIHAQQLPWLAIAFWGMVLAVIAVRIWQLDKLQAEAFGDITTAWLYVDDVLTGKWPFYIPLSTGPLFHYVFAAVTLFAGLSYFGLKLASVLVSLGALAFTYLFARRLLGNAFAVLATFVAGISFWLLIHSRLGNVPIGVPLLSMAMAWLMLRYVQERHGRDLYWSMAVASLGLYTYAAAYLLPATVIATLIALRVFSEFKVAASKWLRVVAIFLGLLLPFIWIITQNSSGFTSAGYLGGKFALTGPALVQLGRNAISGFTAYNIRGDQISRVNPNNLPHLDVISGVLFLVGIWFWLQRKRRREGLVILIPFIMLHFPSMLVITTAQEVPSSTRTVGAAPLAYVLVASGLWQLGVWLRPRFGRILTTALTLVLVVLIAALNLNTYFSTYLQNLPYQNTPIARYITDFLDLLPEETNLYLVGCCWQYSMPEPLSIEYAMKRPEHFHYMQPDQLNCESMDGVLNGPAVLVWSYQNELPSEDLADCAERFPVQLFTSPSGLPMYNAATVQGLHRLEAAEGQLTAQWMTMGGQLVLVRFSVLDTGRIEDAMDGNFNTLMRGLDANPFVLEFEFDEPQIASSVYLTLAAIQEFTVRTTITYADGSSLPIEQEFMGMESDPTAQIGLPPGELPIALIHIEIEDPRAKPEDGYHIHLREIVLNFEE
jgi:uncharacterized membrane protein